MGGGAIRAAAKVAGIGVVNAGIRGGLSGLPAPAEQSVSSASRPVSAIISSAAQGVKTDVQRPAWELDEWEFAGGVEEELAVESAEPLPRLVFGGAPSLQEAEAATADLKDALNKVYLSSPTHVGTDASPAADQSDLPLLANSNNLETKNCIACESKKASVPKHAMMAFSLLNESPQAQSVVASIACDPNVWDAVLKNESLQEFLQSQKTDASVDDDLASPKRFTELSDDDSQYSIFEDKDIDILKSIKAAVVDMVNNFSSRLQNFFGISSTDNTSVDAEEKSRSSFIDNKVMGASFLGLAVMVIMVVVLRRG